MGKYLTAPQPTTEMPKGIPFIVGNEAAERFSFYGMKTILFVFMTQYLLTSDGTPSFLTATQGREWVSWFVASAYFFPVIGALLADAFLGKYRTILLLSIVYCLGHLSLALIDLPSEMLKATFEPKVWLGVGLALVAIGSGGIKPCVSANVGDQFGKSNKHLLSKVFGWFYFAINFGSFFSTLLTPWLLKNYGPGWAFGVPGILMGIATLIFWLGRYRFVHIPPAGISKYIDEFVSGGGFLAVAKIVPIFAFVAVFWSLYDQSGSAWVEQANKMDRQFMGVDWLESQVQAVNPLLILAYIPLFTYVIYPLISSVFPLTPLRKIAIGLFLTVIAFGLSAYIEGWLVEGTARFAQDHVGPILAAGSVDFAATAKLIVANGNEALATAMLNLSAQPSETTALTSALAAGGRIALSSGEIVAWAKPNIAWQLLAYVILTAAEVMVSITCLEFAYTQAPPKMKSFIMSLYLLSVSAGNVFTALVNRLTQDAQGNSTLVGADYYWFFTYVMLGAAIVFIGVAYVYKPREYLQDEAAGGAAA
ncbi:MAG: POT family MFS transporter [Phycisphaerae bacterium]|nr:POT family MFS transporter [Phycisphaerae bacterium]